MKSYDQFINQTNESFVGQAVGALNRGISAVKKVGTAMRRPGVRNTLPPKKPFQSKSPKPSTRKPFQSQSTADRMAAGFDKNRSKIPSANRIEQPKPNVQSAQKAVKSVVKNPQVRSVAKTVGSAVKNTLGNIRGKTYRGGSLGTAFQSGSGIGGDINKGVGDAKITTQKGLRVKKTTVGDKLNKIFNPKPNEERARAIGRKYKSKPTEPEKKTVTTPNTPKDDGGGGSKITTGTGQGPKNPTGGGAASSGSKSKGNKSVSVRTGDGDRVGKNVTSTNDTRPDPSQVRPTDRRTSGTGGADKIVGGKRIDPNKAQKGVAPGQLSMLDGEGKINPNANKPKVTTGRGVTKDGKRTIDSMNPDEKRRRGIGGGSSSGGSTEGGGGAGGTSASGSSRTTTLDGQSKVNKGGSKNNKPSIIKKVVDKTGDAAKNAARKVGDAAKKKAGEVASNVGNAAKKKAGEVASNVGNVVKDKAKKVGKGIKDEVVSGAKELSKNIEKKVADRKKNQPKKSLKQFKKDAKTSEEKGKTFSQSFGTPTGADPKTGKATYTPPRVDSQLPKGKGGKAPTGDQYEKSSKKVGERQAKRNTYLDQNTNKASDQGAQKRQTKAIQMRTGSNKNTKTAERKSKKLMQTPAKGEQKKKINQEYGGRRATRSADGGNTPSSRQSEPTQNTGQMSLKFPVSKAKSQNIQTKSIKNQVTKANQNATKKTKGPNAKSGGGNATQNINTKSKGTKNVKVNMGGKKNLKDSYHWREEFIWETDKKYPDKIKEIKPMTGKNTITINPEDETSKYKRGY